MKTKNTPLYVCEICGNESTSKTAIENCEKKCDCSHDWIYEMDYEGQEIEISKTCKLCKASLKTKSFYDYDNKPKQTFLKRIYDILQ